jgi:renierapurpurin 18,18'-hydroxylase
MLGGKKSGKEKKADVLTIATAYPYQTLHLHRGGAAEPTLTMWSVYIPTDRAQRRNHTYGFVTVRKPKFPTLNWVLWPFVRKFMEAIFAEDRFAVELEQAAHDQQGADWNQEILPFLFDLRDLLAESGVPIEPDAA